MSEQATGLREDEDERGIGVDGNAKGNAVRGGAVFQAPARDAYSREQEHEERRRII